MLYVYRVKLMKMYEFELDAQNEEDVKEQVEHIMKFNKLLEKSYVRKTTRVKARKLYERVKFRNEENN